FSGATSTDDHAVVSYAWAFGDGATGSGVTPTRRYAAAGAYNVTLTVTDAVNQSGTRTCSVQTGTTGTCAP
ncbi:MAG: PKD domain-containing protein, partial [Gemmatimonadaceae bacterium]